MKEFRVLLINPTNSIPINSDFVINIFQPLGIAYIGAMLKKNNINVKIIDALAEGFDIETIIDQRRIIGLKYQTIKDKIKKYNPKIVGITTPFSFQAQEAHQMAKIVKSVNKKIIVVTGGTHATIEPKEMLDDKNIDYVVRGEGEYDFLKFVNNIKNKKSVKKINGLSYINSKNKIIHNPKSFPITNLDNLPLVARNLLPMNKYFTASKKGRVIEGLLLFGQKRTSLITSRGCPFTCTFCSVNLTMTRCWRGRSPLNVVKEINNCVKKYQIKYFDILDDNFTLDPNRAKEICRLIINQKIKIKWSTPNGIRADRLDDELVYLMKKSGCIQVKVAPESGNKKILTDVIKKKLDLKKVESAVQMCKKHNLSIEAFFVIGFPKETEKNIWDTINFGKKLRRLGCDYCYFFIATPYKGTELYDNSISSGYIDIDNYDINTVSTTNNNYYFKNSRVPKTRLFELQKIANSINPPITKIRLIAGLKMLFIDPVRIIKFGYSYLGNFFTSKIHTSS